MHTTRRELHRRRRLHRVGWFMWGFSMVAMFSGLLAAAIMGGK